MSLILDHVSLQTPDWDVAVETLHNRVGLMTTRTPGASAPHRQGISLTAPIWKLLRALRRRSFLVFSPLRPARPNP